MLVALVAITAAIPSVASATTRLSLNRDDVGGAGGRESLRGFVDLETPTSWLAWTAHGAPEARLVYGLSKTCVVSVRAGARGVAHRETSRERAERFTPAPPGVLLGDGRAHAGWWRLVRTTRAFSGPDAAVLTDSLYGIRPYRVAGRRWVDVRLVVVYRGCTETEITDEATHADVERVLRTAKVRARIVRR